ncbi:MAG: hypothetical protein EXS09_14885 [Gemmataceae bacterium]|nr:hypothetical protein [Gemmataceae bacterium]
MGRCIFFFVVVACANSGFGQERPESTADFIVHQRGASPILITAPHGGRTAIPGIAERRGNGIDKFVVVRDDNTLELAEKLAASVEKATGRKPHLIAAKFERKQVDVNRPSTGAYEDEKAKPFYDAYHQAIADACKNIQKNWGRGLLLDIHGQGVDADAIFRGTTNDKSVTALIDRFGKQAISGPKGLFGQLEKQSFKIIPANDSKDKEDSRFNGGHTVRTYGSHDGQAIDAIQLELGGKLRAKANLDVTANKIADAVKSFAKEYLPEKRVKE